jgi:hypothetical protein
VLLGEPTLLEADALLLERAIITAAWNSVLG